MEISIIIPVYNVERYLAECLRSICRQHPQDVEVILVDDGSFDQSGYICDAWEKKYPYITVIHQNNQGPSAARNAGIRAACGKYLLFVDADDYIADGSLAAFVKEVNQHPADLFFLKAYKIYPGGRQKELDHMDGISFRSQSRSDVLQQLAGLPKYPGSCCTKLCSRQMILKYGIFFEEGVRAEDLVWSLKCMLCAGNYGYIGIDYYYYRQMREGSATDVYSKKGARQLYQAIMQGIRLAGQERFPIRGIVYEMVAYEAEVLLLYYGRLKREMRKDLRTEMESVCWLLAYRRYWRTRLVRFLIHMFGIDLAARLLVCAYRLRECMYRIKLPGCFF